MTRRWAAYTLLLALAAALLALSGDAYLLRIATLVGIYAIAAIGFQLVFGRLGLLALSQGAFFAIGAYVLGLTTTVWGWPPLLALAAAVIVPAVAGALVALPAARLETHYVALATLGLSQLVLLAVTNLDVTGGANGLYGVPVLTVLDGEIADGWPMLLTVWTGVALALGVFALTVRGVRAARFSTLRDAPHAARALGLDPIRARLTLFAVAAALGGLAGGFQALGLGVVSPAVARFDVMISLLAIAVVGGRGSAWGAIAGAVVLIPLPELFRGLEQAYLLGYGIVLLAVIVAWPHGIDGLVRRWLPDTGPARPAPRPPSRPAPAALRVEAVTKRFGGVQALDRVDLVARPGEVTGLIGANGSGKTTLMNIVSGLERPDSGILRLGAVPLLGRRAPARARLGLARGFQHPELPSDVTVLDAASVAGDRAAGLWALDRVGLEALADRPVASLGPADSRLFDIARALAAGPSVLLLDEPAAGLTAPQRARLSRLLRSLADDGMAVVVVEHGMDFLLPLADTLVCLDAGRVIAAGPVDAVRRDPAVIAAYLGQEAAA